jgi:hypothetical protein
VIPNTVSSGAQGLNNLLCPLGDKIYIQKEVGRKKLGCGLVDHPEHIYSCV